jgi:hypothetical protein
MYHTRASRTLFLMVFTITELFEDEYLWIYRQHRHHHSILTNRLFNILWKPPPLYMHHYLLH